VSRPPWCVTVAVAETVTAGPHPVVLSRASEALHDIEGLSEPGPLLVGEHGSYVASNPQIGTGKIRQ